MTKRRNSPPLTRFGLKPVPTYRTPSQHRKLVSDPSKFSAMGGQPPEWEAVLKTKDKKLRKRALKRARDPGFVERKPKPKGVHAPDPNKRETFYASWEWRKVRLQVLLKHGRRCQCCGATPEDITITGAKVRLVVDHIKPLGKHWELRLDPNNLQVLCDECNMGKGDWNTDDFRPRA